MIKTLLISGFRGFGKEQKIEFSLPDGKTEGSGLNIIVGANNSGKTTIIESIMAFNGNKPPSFSEGRRNPSTDGRVKLEISDENGNVCTIKTAEQGGSSAEKDPNKSLNLYVIPARRNIPVDFGSAEMSRNEYASSYMELELQRTSATQHFGTRITGIGKKDKEGFDSVLKEILGPDFKWVIEMKDSGTFYVKTTIGSISHSSEGNGDGILNVFITCSALFDVPNEGVIIIDEPELSMHPALQKKLLNVLLRSSKSHQIIISTHSPYFISWEAIIKGKATLIRVNKEDGNSICYPLKLKGNARVKLSGLLDDIYNPHILSLEGNEIFFLEDKVILVEGQEDVLVYNKIAKELGKHFEGNFFGWGVGGSDKMRLFLPIFQNLGYKKVVVILDGDEKTACVVEEIKNSFPQYKIETLPTDDVRDKDRNKTGIADRKGKIKDEYRDYANNLIDGINAWLLS